MLRKQGPVRCGFSRILVLEGTARRSSMTSAPVSTENLDLSNRETRARGDTLRTVLIAPSLRLAHSPLEDGRKHPDERSTQPTLGTSTPARHHRSRRALSAAT